jgi:protein-S-isoprenylcysteine O-methyltransferase Ste14
MERRSQKAREQDDLVMSSARDVPKVVVFPPLVAAFVLVVGSVLGIARPVGVLARIPSLGRIVIGATAFTAGMAMVIGANRTFRRIGTPVRPSQPTLALATTGVFTRVRNPMYLGGSLALVGVAVGFALDWVLVLLVASLPLLHYGIVLPEERYLEGKFGDDYQGYKTRVPRYLPRLKS